MDKEEKDLEQVVRDFLFQVLDPEGTRLRMLFGEFKMRNKKQQAMHYDEWVKIVENILLNWDKRQ